MSDRDLSRTIARILARTGVTYSALALAAGVSVSTAMRFVEAGRLPSRAGPRAAFERFARVNERAQVRADLRFC